jgi:long-chain acyl-CoA synthetase
MFTVRTHAERDPDRAAVIYGNGDSIESYGALEERSRRLVHVFRSWGLEPGDCVAVLLGNDDAFFDVFWACHRAGLYLTPVNWHLQRDELRYIVENCDSKVFLAHSRFAEVAHASVEGVERVAVSASLGGEIPGFRSLEDALSGAPRDAPLGEELEGSVMLYSSGTTGRPKGVRRPLRRVPAGDPATVITAVGLTALFGMKEGDVYLSPAPLYHAAPLVFASSQHRIGATTVVMRRFDPEQALRIIADQKVTTSQWVPTHFKRLLSLPEPVRTRYDVSTLRVAVHAAAPCPIPVKEAMIAWWGDAIMEYYAGTEGGGTLIRADEWKAHKGSVGRHWSGGRIHVLDDDGRSIEEPGREGAIYFEAPPDPAARFQYYKDETKTAGTYRGDLFTIGDIGMLDADGYLYLTDRQSNMIISGGVNIYPQETESHLITDPRVYDVAVIGVPNDDLGEEVKAVVVPAPGSDPTPALANDLIEYCRAHIAHYKCPRSIDFVTALPRTETGKMQKRRLRDHYWQSHTGRLV